MNAKLEKIIKAIRALALPDDAAEMECSGHVIAFASGSETEVEVARSGEFKDMNGTVVKVTPDLMQRLAESYDPAAHEPKIKLGHEPVNTATPDYGSVTGLSYDSIADRLRAKIKPTMALIRQVREGAFNQRSMEFAMNPKTGDAKFLHLSFLGFRKPAIGGLAEVALAGTLAVPQDAEGIYRLSLDPDEEPAGDGEVKPEPVAAAPVVPEPAKSLDSPDITGTVKVIEAAKPVETEKQETKQMSADAKKTRTDAIVKSACEDKVTSFLAVNVKRIPADVVKLVKNGMASLMFAETEMESGEIVLMAGADGAETKQTPSAFIFALLAALPEQIAKSETVETPAPAEVIATEPTTAELAEFAGCEPASIQKHLAAKAEQAADKAKGVDLSYFEAVKRVEGRK